LNRDVSAADYKDEWWPQQCLHCKFYIALSGELGSDFGVCANAVAVFDGQVRFEHDGCDHHERSNMWDEDN